MDDIFEILRKLEQSNSIDSFKQYVYYDPIDGKLQHIRNYIETEDKLPYIEIDSNDFDESIDIRRFAVFEEDGKKKLIKLVDDSKLLTVDDFIHIIPRKTVDKDFDFNKIDFDLLIEQNNKLKEFKIVLSKSAKFNLASVIENSKRIVLYLTEENDPNILYKTLDIPMIELVKDDYIIKFDDYDGLPANIYSIRYFENYIHLDIR